MVRAAVTAAALAPEAAATPRFDAFKALKARRRTKPLVTAAAAEPEPKPEPEPQLKPPLAAGAGGGCEVWLGNIPHEAGSEPALASALAGAGMGAVGSAYTFKKFVAKASRNVEDGLGYCILTLPPPATPGPCRLRKLALALDGHTLRLPCGTEFTARVRLALPQSEKHSGGVAAASKPPPQQHAAAATPAATAEEAVDPPLMEQLMPILGSELTTQLIRCLANPLFAPLLLPFGLVPATTAYSEESAGDVAGGSSAGCRGVSGRLHLSVPEMRRALCGARYSRTQGTHIYRETCHSARSS